MKLLERLSNLAVIVAAVVVITAYFNNRYRPPSGLSATRVASERVIGELVGKKIILPGVDLAEPGLKKVLLVLSTSCHFCTESAPFYRQLRSLEAKTGAFKLVAALPQTNDEAESYLSEKGVRVDAITSSKPLAALGLRNTPTLVVVGPFGEVERAWIGLLSPERQREVLSKL